MVPAHELYTVECTRRMYTAQKPSITVTRKARKLILHESRLCV